jgi:hypothetical protein
MYKIRSVHGPLIKGLWELAKIEGIERKLNRIGGIGFLGECSKKGNGRKSTENRVTR